MQDPTSSANAATAHGAPISTGVQVLSILMFGTFSIVAVVLAFANFWPAGVAVAGLIAWRGGFLPHRDHGGDLRGLAAQLAPQSGFRPSGNSTFDAYRIELLKRLETEQQNFESFLGRLRDAKDKTEFDGFMDDRARKTDPLVQLT